MIRMARFCNLLALSLAISSFLGLMARHLPPVTIGLVVIFVLVVSLFLGALIAGNVVDHHFGWEQDTAVALALGLLAVYVIGGLIGWLVA